ncbi:hypothetical protein SEA_GUYFAGIERI_34 [Rhodococcus phage GuyFagieri]|nr:hypothetical protein SEA_GUYFAGIERI_34 [Rhodococcus phage GuyFagieri]
MAQAKLKCYTILRENLASAPVTFGPDSVLPDWALKLVAGKDHLFEGAAPAPTVRIPAPSEEVPEPELNPEGSAVVLEPAATELGKSENLPPEDDDEDEDDEDDGDDGDDGPKAPSRGASEMLWREFAAASGVPVTDEMGRNDIIAACEAAEVIDPK